MAGSATRGGARASAPAVRRARPDAAVELRKRVDRLFRGSVAAATDMRVGVEVELIPVHGRPPRPTPRHRSHRALMAHDPALLADACISYEPGGQVELSPPPQPSPAALLDSLDGLLARVDGALARDGIVAVSSGLNPWHGAADVAMQLDAERYRVMQRHFDGIGRHGREMMRLTAGLQICVDMIAGDEGVEQWVLANRMGPALSAAFAASGAGAGTATGWSGSRCLIWQKLDALRTGFDGAQVASHDPAAAYAHFAGSALAMPLSRGEGTGSAPAVVPSPLSFAEWTARGDARPDAEDVTHHLSTLFPPVRPRGYLEIRYLDMPPRRWLSVPVVVVDTLLRDAVARREALAALGDVDRATLLATWEAAAHQGVVNPWLRREAQALVEIATAAVRRAPDGTVPPSAVASLRAFSNQYLSIRRCWSDDQAERITGPDAEDPSAWT